MKVIWIIVLLHDSNVFKLNDKVLRKLGASNHHTTSAMSDCQRNVFFSEMLVLCLM